MVVGVHHSRAAIFANHFNLIIRIYQSSPSIMPKTSRRRTLSSLEVESFLNEMADLNTAKNRLDPTTNAPEVQKEVIKPVNSLNGKINQPSTSLSSQEAQLIRDYCKVYIMFLSNPLIHSKHMINFFFSFI